MHLGASIRIGAQQAHLLSLVLGDGMKLLLIGLSIGLVASLALTRFVASVLYGVSSTDPATFFTVALLYVYRAGGLLDSSPSRHPCRSNHRPALRLEFNSKSFACLGRSANSDAETRFPVNA